jgi:hypothetical protein
LMGDTPCGADATMFAFVTSIITPALESPIRDAAMAQANLVAYRDRVMQRYFPDLAKAGAP